MYGLKAVPFKRNELFRSMMEGLSIKTSVFHRFSGSVKPPASVPCSGGAFVPPPGVTGSASLPDDFGEERIADGRNTRLTNAV
jgi:hypothetical protein